MSRPATLVRGKLFVVFEYGKDDSVRSVSSWTPSFPSVFGEGGTERLAVLSLRKGIQIHLEPEKPEKPAHKVILLKPYTKEEKEQFIKKWEKDCEGESIIKSTVINLT